MKSDKAMYKLTFLDEKGDKKYLAQMIEDYFLNCQSRVVRSGVAG